MKYIKYVETKLGKIGIVEENGKIVKIVIKNGYDKCKNNKEENIKKKNKENNIIDNSIIIDNNIYEERDTKLLLEAKKQLEEYFEGKRKVFDLPLEQEGTAFQKRVWEALENIPYGETRTYKEVAKMIGNEKASRAVGMANNKNNIPIIVPCHRVIGSNGKLVGYALGLDMKKYLLDLEKRNK